MAIVKCSAHKKVTNKIGQGNAFVDEIAKQTARDVTSLILVTKPPEQRKETTIDLTLDGIKLIQSAATEEEQKCWSMTGIHIKGCWMDQTQSKYMLPDKMVCQGH